MRRSAAGTWRAGTAPPRSSRIRTLRKSQLALSATPSEPRGRRRRPSGTARNGPSRLLRGVSGSRTARPGERVTDELRVADDEGAVDQDVPDARRVRMLTE